MQKQDIAGFQRLLEQRQAELQQLRNASSEGRGPVALDQQSVGRVSRIDAMQRQAMAQAQERQRAEEAVRIERALTRIAEGEYGYCLDCDEEIPIKRLQVDPAAALCVHCAGR